LQQNQTQQSTIQASILFATVGQKNVQRYPGGGFTYDASVLAIISCM